MFTLLARGYGMHVVLCHTVGPPEVPALGSKANGHGDNNVGADICRVYRSRGQKITR